MADAYTGPTFPAYIQQNNVKPSYVDIVAVHVGNSVNVSVVNRHPEAEWVADFCMDDFGKWFTNEKKGNELKSTAEIASVKITEVYEDNLLAAVSLRMFEMSLVKAYRRSNASIGSTPRTLSSRMLSS